MNTNCTLAQIGAVLQERQRFLVVSHFRPDGDAIGCSLAMGLCLQQLGKDVTVWNEDGLPERFAFLPGSTLVTQPPEVPVAFDVVVVLDTAVRERVGARTLAAIAPGALWLNLDHHVSNDRKGDLVYVDTSAPAAGQILFELFEQCSFSLRRHLDGHWFFPVSEHDGSHV